jgi:hypothetical protein
VAGTIRHGSLNSATYRVCSRQRFECRHITTVPTRRPVPPAGRRPVLLSERLFLPNL